MLPHHASQVYCLCRPFREGDLRRLIKAIRAGGAKVGAIEFTPDGQIKVICEAETGRGQHPRAIQIEPR
jgi:hypothetical protein